MGAFLRLALDYRALNRQLICQLFLAWQLKQRTSSQIQSLMLYSQTQRIVSTFTLRIRAYIPGTLMTLPGLTLNVVRPATATASSKIPVVVVSHTMQSKLLAVRGSDLLWNHSGFLVVALSSAELPCTYRKRRPFQIFLMHPCRYDGGAIVSRSIALNQPVIYVSMNYRYVPPSVLDNLHLRFHKTA